jgi:hypothetical protein
MNDTVDINTGFPGADTEFPALFQLFGGYFHEDWRSEHAQPAAALAAFKAEAPPEAVREAVAELDRLLTAGLDDGALSRLLDEGFGCNYLPTRDGMNATTWLEHVLDSLRVSAAR